MKDTPRRIRRSWQIGVIVCMGLGVLALIPLAVDLHDFWPWVPFVSVFLWIVGGVVYGLGMRATGKPLQHARDK